MCTSSAKCRLGHTRVGTTKKSQDRNITDARTITQKTVFFQRFWLEDYGPGMRACVHRWYWLTDLNESWAAFRKGHPRTQVQGHCPQLHSKSEDGLGCRSPCKQTHKNINDNNNKRVKNSPRSYMECHGYRVLYLISVKATEHVRGLSMLFSCLSLVIIIFMIRNNQPKWWLMILDHQL